MQTIPKGMLYLSVFLFESVRADARSTTYSLVVGVSFTLSACNCHSIWQATECKHSIPSFRNTGWQSARHTVCKTYKESRILNPRGMISVELHVKMPQ